MFAHIRSLVDGDPVSLLGHMFFVEYFTVITAPDLLQGLEKSGFRKKYFTSVSNHAELDVHHIEDDLKAFQRFVSSPS